MLIHTEKKDFQVERMTKIDKMWVEEEELDEGFHWVDAWMSWH